VVEAAVAQSADAGKSFIAFEASMTLQVVALIGAAVATPGAAMSNPPTLTEIATAEIALRMASPRGESFP